MKITYLTESVFKKYGSTPNVVIDHTAEGKKLAAEAIKRHIKDTVCDKICSDIQYYFREYDDTYGPISWKHDTIQNIDISLIENQYVIMFYIKNPLVTPATYVVNDDTGDVEYCKTNMLSLNDPLIGNILLILESLFEYYNTCNIFGEDFQDMNIVFDYKLVTLDKFFFVYIHPRNSYNMIISRDSFSTKLINKINKPTNDRNYNELPGIIDKNSGDISNIIDRAITKMCASNMYSVYDWANTGCRLIKLTRNSLSHRYYNILSLLPDIQVIRYLMTSSAPEFTKSGSYAYGVINDMQKIIGNNLIDFLNKGNRVELVDGYNSMISSQEYSQNLDLVNKSRSSVWEGVGIGAMTHFFTFMRYLIEITGLPIKPEVISKFSKFGKNNNYNKTVFNVDPIINVDAYVNNIFLKELSYNNYSEPIYALFISKSASDDFIKLSVITHIRKN